MGERAPRTNSIGSCGSPTGSRTDTTRHAIDLRRRSARAGAVFCPDQPEAQNKSNDGRHEDRASSHAAQSFAVRRILGRVDRLDARRDGFVHLCAGAHARADRAAAAFGLRGGMAVSIAGSFGWAFYLPHGLAPFTAWLFVLGFFGGNFAVFSLWLPEQFETRVRATALRSARRVGGLSGRG